MCVGVMLFDKLLLLPFQKLLSGGSVFDLLCNLDSADVQHAQEVKGLWRRGFVFPLTKVEILFSTMGINSNQLRCGSVLGFHSSFFHVIVLNSQDNNRFGSNSFGNHFDKILKINHIVQIES